MHLAFLFVSFTLRTMQIFIKTPNGRTITLEVDLSDTIGDIKEKIEEREGYSPSQQRLSLDGSATKPLENDSTLGDYDIKGGETINLSVAVAVPDRESSSCCNII